MKLAEYLKSVRAERGLKQHDISVMAGFSEGLWGWYERGRAPKVSHLNILREFLGGIPAEVEIPEIPKHPKHTHCKRGHALAEGNLLYNGIGGRQCLQCVRDIRKRYYLDNRERSIKKAAEWGKMNPERRNESANKSRARNRDEWNKRARERRATPEGRARNDKYQEKYREKNWDKIKVRFRDRYRNDPAFREKILENSKENYQLRHEWYRSYWKERRKDPEMIKWEKEYREKNAEHFKKYHKEHYQDLKRTNPQKITEQARKANRKAIDELSDSYIRLRLRQVGFSPEVIRNNPEMIELKRAEIKLQRIHTKRKNRRKP